VAQGDQPEPDREDRQRDDAVGQRELAVVERRARVVMEEVEDQVDRLERERPQVGDGVRRVAGQAAAEEEAAREREENREDRDHRRPLSP